MDQDNTQIMQQPAQEAQIVPVVDPRMASVEHIVGLALQTNNMEALERAMDLRNKELARLAEIDFRDALAKFQGECPVIQKNQQAKGRSFSYWYASYDEIYRTVQPHLVAAGLSVSYRFEFPERCVQCIMTVAHTSGHKSEYNQVVPIDTESHMNDSQKVGSAQSYAKRYAIIGALGLAIAGEDDDGARAGARAPMQQPRRQSQSQSQTQSAARESAHSPAPSGSEATAQPEQPAPSSPIADAEPGNQPDWSKPGWIQTYIDIYDAKPFKSPKGDGLRHAIKYRTGQGEVWASTFSETDGAALKDAYYAKQPIYVRIEQNGKYLNIVEVYRHAQ